MGCGQSSVSKGQAKPPAQAKPSSNDGELTPPRMEFHYEAAAPILAKKHRNTWVGGLTQIVGDHTGMFDALKADVQESMMEAKYRLESLTPKHHHSVSHHDPDQHEEGTSSHTTPSRSHNNSPTRHRSRTQSHGTVKAVPSETGHTASTTPGGGGERSTTVHKHENSSKIGDALLPKHMMEHITTFDTYELLFVKARIRNVFGDAYQRNFDKAHAPIFGDDAVGIALRATFMMEHAALYRDGILPSYMHGGKERTAKAELRSGSDFLAFIEDSVRLGQRRVYTYTLTDDGLFFSETGIAVSKDMFSKHILHANGQVNSVRCAGTFRVCIAESEKRVMVVDNDSGTFRPSFEAVQNFALFMRRSFPGLEVRPMNVLEPQPEETLDWIGPVEVGAQRIYKGKWKWKVVFADGTITSADEIVRSMTHVPSLKVAMSASKSGQTVTDL